MALARKENGMWVVEDRLVMSRHDFDGTADAVKSSIDSIVEEAKSLGMVGDGHFDVGNNFYDEIEIKYFFTRTENDTEKAAREKREAKVKADAKAKRDAAAAKRKLKKDAEFAEYERLKAKFKGL